jgi:hypothetical protein
MLEDNKQPTPQPGEELVSVARQSTPPPLSSFIDYALIGEYGISFSPEI